MIQTPLSSSIFSAGTNPKKGKTLKPKEILIAVIALTFIGGGIACYTGMAVGGDLFKHRTITGTVVAEGSRLAPPASGKSTINQKIGLNLTNVDGDEKILSNYKSDTGTLLVDCDSTRCSALTDGQRVELSCMVDGRNFRPNVVVCDVVK